MLFRSEFPSHDRGGGAWGALAQGINNTTNGLIWDNIASDRAMNDWRDQQYQNMENSWYLSNIDYANKMNMWRETGPVGMMKEYEKAGLNPALMYKQGGGSGSTAASVPAAPQATFQRGSAAGNVWAAGVQGAIAESQIEVNKAQADALRADAEAKRGYTKDKAIYRDWETKRKPTN